MPTVFNAFIFLKQYVNLWPSLREIPKASTRSEFLKGFSSESGMNCKKSDGSSYKRLSRMSTSFLSTILHPLLRQLPFPSWRRISSSSINNTSIEKLECAMRFGIRTSSSKISSNPHRFGDDLRLSTVTPSGVCFTIHFFLASGYTNFTGWFLMSD